MHKFSTKIVNEKLYINIEIEMPKIRFLDNDDYIKLEKIKQLINKQPVDEIDEAIDEALVPFVEKINEKIVNDIEKCIDTSLIWKKFKSKLRDFIIENLDEQEKQIYWSWVKKRISYGISDIEPNIKI